MIRRFSSCFGDKNPRLSESDMDYIMEQLVDFSRCQGFGKQKVVLLRFKIRPSAIKRKKLKTFQFGRSSKIINQ